jgi:branched-chain amino acid transport system substrate-binding protein
VTRAAKEYLARKRPDIQIAGDDLHPLGQVKDFAPHVAKIKSSDADTVITGNWGNDMTLLIKAAKETARPTASYRPLTADHPRRSSADRARTA